MRNNVLLMLHNKQELNKLSKNLQSAYNVFVASNMAEVQQVLQTISIQLIICSVDMPGVNGYFASSHPAAGSTSHMNDDNELISKLNEVILSNMQNRSLNVNLLAKLMTMSRATLYRKIKNITGLTPNGLINLARLKQAASLLRSGGYRIFEIAGMVGFRSQSSFGKAFMKQFKVTPSQYLRMEEARLQNKSRLPEKHFYTTWYNLPGAGIPGA